MRATQRWVDEHGYDDEGREMTRRRRRVKGCGEGGQNDDEEGGNDTKEGRDEEEEKR